jgi:hypothetical protein
MLACWNHNALYYVLTTHAHDEINLTTTVATTTLINYYMA